MEDVRTTKEWISREKKKTLTFTNKSVLFVCDDNAFP